MAVLVALLIAAASAQITTADAFFSSVSEFYGSIKDYSAQISVAQGSQKKAAMVGTVWFKKPDLLRIDFTTPSEQTIVFNGEILTIYLPSPDNVILTQSVGKASGSSGASLATPQGLSLMKRYYSVAYESGPDPVPLEQGSSEYVVALLLTRRSTSEMFRTIRLLVSPDTKLIRRIDARTISGDQIVIDFTGYSLNQGILDNRFVYDPPASANMYSDFLFAE